MSDAEQRLRDVINNIALEHGYVDYDTELETFTTGGANYTSQLYHITLSEPGKNDLKLFAKVATITESLRAETPYRIFETEIFFYCNLLKRYQELEIRNNVPKEHRLATVKFYAFNEEYLNEVIVLEDISRNGFDVQDRMKSFTWEYASKSVVELAKLHALSIALLNENPEEYDSLCVKLRLSMNMENFKRFVQSVTSMSLTVIKEENKGKVETFLRKLQNYDHDHFLKPLSRPVIAHGDFRSSNLMYRDREDGQQELMVLDYQTLQMSNPIIDLMYFIFTGSDEEFRAHHYRQLLDHYHAELSNALTRLGVDATKAYSKEDFEHELKEIQPYGLFIGLMMLPMITVDAENAPKMDSNCDISDFFIKPNERAAARLNGLINDFIKFGVL